MSRADYPRVTHPFAAVPRPEGLVLARLACVKRAASVRPEPGSNSPGRMIRRRIGESFHFELVLKVQARRPVKGLFVSSPMAKHRPGLDVNARCSVFKS